MKSIPKLIRRFVSIMLLSFVLLLSLNFLLLAIYTANQLPNRYPWTTAEEVAGQLRQGGQGYVLPKETALELKNSDIWAILIDNATMQVVWHTDNLPEAVPLSYSASDIASLTRGYIHGYPTFPGEAEDGLVVLGYPQDSFWKHMWPSWDFHQIANLPGAILFALAMNVALVFVIYATANSRLLKSIRPIVSGILSLPTEERVFIAEKGLLSELALSINRTSEILHSQRAQLYKKETARANWIAGVSHDIRTPLSMVMGYAGQLREDLHITDANRQKAAAIVKQSERMRDLINDLNLASKLEYHMQPVHLKKENMVAIVRQVAVDFINTDIDGKYPIVWETDESLAVCFVHADKGLVKRAVGNLVQNCINHNGQGCTIHVSVLAEGSSCAVAVGDDGVGAADGLIERLNNSPHYMLCDENTTEQRHGLGLLIVKQIAAAHGGTVVIGHSPYGGFYVKLILPMLE